MNTRLDILLCLSFSLFTSKKRTSRSIQVMENKVCKSLMGLGPFGFHELFACFCISKLADFNELFRTSETIWNWPKFREFSDRFLEFSDFSQVFGPFACFWTSKSSFGFGSRVSEPFRNRPVSYHSANSKKSQFYEGLNGEYHKYLVFFQDQYKLFVYWLSLLDKKNDLAHCLRHMRHLWHLH